MTMGNQQIREKLKKLKKLGKDAFEIATEGSKPGPEITTPVWEFPRDYWQDPQIKAERCFPEQPQALQAKRDLGVCFSGGGTRAASAALGFLRGLHSNKWLPHVRYVVGISGGSWTATPFTFSTQPLDELLESAVEPEQIAFDGLQTTRPRSLAGNIKRSSLKETGGRAALLIYESAFFDRVSDRASKEAFDDALRIQGDLYEHDVTYSEMIGEVFFNERVAGARTRYFTWNHASEEELVTNNRDVVFGDIARPPDGRPFLIACGTIVRLGDAQTYPTLIPVEYTPYYSGVRQQFGDEVGGTFVLSAAYDGHSPVALSGNRARVITRSARKPFTLADVIGSSGAAPQLHVLLAGTQLPLALRNTPLNFFPQFDCWTMRKGQCGPTMFDVPHGDGGFLDNLGLMPLVGRQVRNIIVCVSSTQPFFENNDLRTYFGLSNDHSGSGDRRLAKIFAPERHWELMEAFCKQTGEGKPLIHLGKGWDVLENEHYNVQPYKDVNICWMYVAPLQPWWKRLPKAVQGLIPDPREQGITKATYVRFPYYRTFFENGRLIEMTAEEVQLLAHLTSFYLTEPESRRRIEDFFGRSVLG